MWEDLRKDSRKLSTEAGHMSLTYGAGRLMGPPRQPPVAMSILYHLKDCISAVYSSRFDLRAQLMLWPIYTCLHTP
jgi:hypothetical protein